MIVIFPRVCSPRSAALGALSLFAAAVWLIAPSAATELSVRLERLESRGVAAGPIFIRLADGPPVTLQVTVGEITLQGERWRNVRVACADFSWARGRIECRTGEADVGTKIPLSFRYSTVDQTLEVALRPAAGEAWIVGGRLGEPGSLLRLEVTNGALARLAAWLPPDWPKISAGTFTGVIRLDGKNYDRFSAELSVRDVAFSNASGTQAADKLGARVRLSAESKGASWSYRATLDWEAGELYWQPLYLRAAGQRVSATGAFDERKITVTEGQLRLPALGDVRASATWDRQSGRLVSADMASGALDASQLYARVLKPFFFGTALGELRVEGETGIEARWREGGLQGVDVRIHDLSFEDANRRFAVFGADGRIPWDRTEETKVELEMKGGELLRVPFGPVKLPLTMRGMRFRLDTVNVPLLDGVLTMRAFATEPPQEGWRWAFGGRLSPVSMERFTQAVGLPAMHGTISADIPRVTYSRSTLRMDGALLFKVFDGTMTVDNLKLIEPFGKAPRLAADLEARRIDLGLLTRAFSFGSITGRIDAAVTGLELAGWQPVKFDAKLESSEGEYSRKISQRAVQNITALGGAGAAAAIQGSFLRFFREFGYEKLGFRCRLQNGVCTMGGIEDAPQGYVIVKGGGIPALTVMGYNRAVDWSELVDRVKRVIQENVRMIVQ